jgi:hypothetical protein
LTPIRKKLIDAKLQMSLETSLPNLPKALRDDKVAINYIRELQSSNDSISHHSYAKGLSYNEGTPEQILGKELFEKLNQSGMRQREIWYLAKVLPLADIEVVLKDEQIPASKYIHLAKIRRMSPQELLSYTINYSPRLENITDIRKCSVSWTKLERSILEWNMGTELGRSPTSEEVEKKLADEILSTGGSHSKRCRAFCYLDHPEWFIKKEKPSIAA